MTAAPPPSPARFAQGDPVRLPHGAYATVSVVYPPDLFGSRRYGVAAWSPSEGAFVEVGVADEADLAPAAVS